MRTKRQRGRGRVGGIAEEAAALLRLAGNMRTPSAELDRIYHEHVHGQFDSSFTRLIFADPRLTGEQRRAIRRALAGNPSLSIMLLFTLAYFEPEAVATNPSLPLALLEDPGLFDRLRWSLNPFDRETFEETLARQHGVKK